MFLILQHVQHNESNTKIQKNSVLFIVTIIMKEKNVITIIMITKKETVHYEHLIGEKNSRNPLELF